MASSAIARNRVLFWIIYACAFLALGVWLGINAIIGRRNAGQPIAAWEPLTWELSSVALVAVLVIGVYRFERRCPLSGTGWLRRLPLHLPAAIVFSLAHVAGMFGIRKFVYAWHGDRYEFGDPSLAFAYEFQKDLITYAIIVGTCVAWRAVLARRERELAVIRLERDLSEARLAQLTAQIEPHFMFNTLNAISNRMHEDIDAADRMIAAFAELLRAALSESGSAHVKVADDVVWLERYFELMRERFRGKLETSIAVEPSAHAARIPRLLLQPLVENAFEHGLKSGRGRVEVAIGTRGGRLHCTVDDDGAGIAADFNAGVGLANVRSRLELLYPGDHCFTIAPRAGGGTHVDIELPLVNDG
ncbi:sensor histidine kinase [Dokdonella soli]|uniref:Histidine kinase/HSP90-like ATPase domain-containing protein n=1 Tax=Dokdonella soli TaxID=529810 RepID=A0ABN1IZ01_9GAMM